MAECDRILSIAPRCADVYALRSGAYLNRGDASKAIADASEAIRLDPQCAQAYGYRAAAYKQTGDTAKADADQERIKKIRSIEN